MNTDFLQSQPRIQLLDVCALICSRRGHYDTAECPKINPKINPKSYVQEIASYAKIASRSGSRRRSEKGGACSTGHGGEGRSPPKASPLLIAQHVLHNTHKPRDAVFRHSTRENRGSFQAVAARAQATGERWKHMERLSGSSVMSTAASCCKPLLSGENVHGSCPLGSVSKQHAR